MGEERYGRFMASFDEDAPVSIRVNRRKCGTEPVDGIKVEWCGDGYYLSARPNFTFDPLFHAGWYYVQEASSMFVWRALKQYLPDTPVVALDMCAAPGGKTTAVLSVLPEGSMMVCNEPMRPRANILAENIQKWGEPRVIVTNNYPKDFARSQFIADVIVCDVPCSGEGMFRKDEGAIGEWSTQNVENCARLQREIVGDAWKCLRSGGVMIYSTCTFNIKEDEENVAWIQDSLGGEVLPVDISEEWGITGSLLAGFDSPIYRFIPGTAKGEGLFMAVIRKPLGNDGDGGENAVRCDERRAKHSKDKRKTARKDTVKVDTQWLDCQSDYEIMKRGEQIVAIPKDMSGICETLSAMKIVHAGVTLGETKGKDIIPDQSLALSTALRKDAFPTVELTYSLAICYLRKEAFPLPDDTPRGHILMTYRGAPLGFMKNIGNRANNLYPQEWKIKSSHVPEEQTIMINLIRE